LAPRQASWSSARQRGIHPPAQRRIVLCFPAGSDAFRAAPAAGDESHAGQVFTCVAALDLAGRLDLVDADLLCWW
jgi:hypothetical protein